MFFFFFFLSVQRKKSFKKIFFFPCVLRPNQMDAAVITKALNQPGSTRFGSDVFGACKLISSENVQNIPLPHELIQPGRGDFQICGRPSRLQYHGEYAWRCLCNISRPIVNYCHYVR